MMLKRSPSTYIWCRANILLCTTILAILSRLQGVAFTNITISLVNLTALETLDFNGQHNSGDVVIEGGPLPPELSALTNLTYLGVSGPLTGPIPPSYTSWSKLQTFRVAGTSLTGTIPPAVFTSWPLLVNFSIDGAQISGTVPATVFSRATLQELIVQHTPVTDNVAGGVLPWFVDPQAKQLTQLVRVGFGEWLAFPQRSCNKDQETYLLL